METELIKRRRQELGLPEYKMDCMDELTKLLGVNDREVTKTQSKKHNE